MKPSALNLFDGILYINLAIRPDRKKILQKEFKKLKLLPDKIHRIEGFYDELNGTRGCAYSHAEALDFAVKKGWKNVLILEDDCLFVKSPEEIDAYVHTFFDYFQENWDVFFLGTKLRESDPTPHDPYLQVRFALGAHAYVVNGPYLAKLRDYFRYIYQSMREDVFFTTSFEKAIDRQWAYLQAIDRWFAAKEMVAQQRACFSDIEKRFKRQR